MVNKITTPPTQNEVIDKINEIIDGKQDTISDLATIRSGATGNVKLNGGSSQQTISLTSGTGTTSLGVKSMSGSSYISFSGSSGWLASFGIGSDKKPTIYDGSSHVIAYTSDIPTVNNPTITFTQGGTTKGTITLNQSSNQTIAFDAGGGGGSTFIPYGESDSAADATQKEVTISEITALNAGQIIIVKPTITSTVADATLKLNNFTAYPILYGAAAITTSTDSITWAANYPSWFRFDGSNWVFLGHGVDNNTTYSAMSVSEGTTGTKTTARTVRADYLKQIIQGTKLTGLSTSTNSAVTATDTVLVGIGKLQAQVNGKQATLVSGTNIKTINGNSLLGRGNIEIQTGGTITVDGELSTTSENPVQNKVVTAAISDLSSQINIDDYLDLIIAGNTQDLPITMQGTYDTDLTNIIGGTYVNV